MRFLLLLAVVVMSGCAPQAGLATDGKPTVDVAAYASQVRASEIYGQKLYAAYQAAAPVDSKLVTLARESIKDACDYSYRTFRVDDGGATYLYFIGETASGSDLVWGRHYRVEVDPEGLSVLSVIPSTKSCFVMPPETAPEGSQAVGSYITHLLSEYPSEFHVFMSLKTGESVAVGTKTATWMVDDGKIRAL